MQAFWTARDSIERWRASQAILETGAGYDAILTALRAGPRYPRTATGRQTWVRRDRDGIEYPLNVWVPRAYDPSRRYPVDVYLHGAIGTAAGWHRGGRWWAGENEFAAPDRLTVFPAAWSDAMWWQPRQAENLQATLHELKRIYNVDENRVYLLGFSDGGTGAFFHALRYSTPWAAFVPMMGLPSVLSTPRFAADGDLFAVNLANRPLFVINGEVDPLYPPEEVRPFIDLFREAGAELTFGLVRSGHDLDWVPRHRRAMQGFLANRTRQPYPDRIVWETERVERYNRHHWLIIDELGPGSSDADLPDLNSIVPPVEPSLGVDVDPESVRGVRVLAVDEGSPARRAGLRAGDVMLQVAERATPTIHFLAVALTCCSFGDTVVIRFQRDGEIHVVDVPLPTAGVSPPPVAAFPRSLPSGRVELRRTGNTVTARTRGVRRYRLLLSPEQFDLHRPIRVETNGNESFHAVVTPDPGILLKWAAIDRDRTMLFAAEITIDVGR